MENHVHTDIQPDSPGNEGERGVDAPLERVVRVGNPALRTDSPAARFPGSDQSPIGFDTFAAFCSGDRR